MEKKEMKKYKALKRGFDGYKLIEKGEIFMFAGPKGKWMQEVGEDHPVKKSKSGKARPNLEEEHQEPEHEESNSDQDVI